MPKQHILIAGAGIAGLALAVQLYTHAKDYYDVSVFEKVGCSGFGSEACSRQIGWLVG